MRVPARIRLGPHLLVQRVHDRLARAVAVPSRGPESLSADLNLSAFKDTYDHSCFLAHLE
jgi:hypothetical protein